MCVCQPGERGMDRKAYKLGARDALEMLKFIKETRNMSWEDAWKYLYTSIAEDTLMDLMRELRV